MVRMGFFRHCVQTGCRAHPATYPMRKGALSPGVKRPGREEYSTPSSAEIKNALPHVFMALTVLKHSDNLISWL